MFSLVKKQDQVGFQLENFHTEYVIRLFWG